MSKREQLPDTDGFLPKKWQPLLDHLRTRAREYDQTIRVLAADNHVFEIKVVDDDYGEGVEARVTDLGQSINSQPMVTVQELGCKTKIIVEMHSWPIFAMLYSG